MARERVALGGIEAHRQVEGALRRRQPIRFLVRARALILEIKIERSVGVIGEWHPTRDGEPVQTVRHLKAFGVIQGDGPEGLHRRRGALVEMDHVVVGAIKRLASRICEIEGIDGVLGRFAPRPSCATIARFR